MLEDNKKMPKVAAKIFLIQSAWGFSQIVFVIYFGHTFAGCPDRHKTSTRT